MGFLNELQDKMEQMTPEEQHRFILDVCNYLQGQGLAVVAPEIKDSQ